MVTHMKLEVEFNDEYLIKALAMANNKSVKEVGAYTDEKKIEMLFKHLRSYAAVNVKNMNDINYNLSVSTPEGELRAYRCTDSDYPGICVMLEPSGLEEPTEIDIALVEYNSDKGLRSFSWGDAMDEDYTHAEEIRNIQECRDHRNNVTFDRE